MRGLMRGLMCGLMRGPIRRPTRGRTRGLALAFAAALTAAASAQTVSPAPCGDQLPAPGRQLIQGPDYALAFSPSPWPIPVGQHFSVRLQVCPQSGKPMPSAVRIDAEMPQHRHGMNYRASVNPQSEGHYLAEGLMFHMPGRWRFWVELTAQPAVVRLQRDVDVQ